MNGRNERAAFLGIYYKFDRWMIGLDFKDVMTHFAADFRYSHYNDKVDTLYGVEHQP